MYGTKHRPHAEDAKDVSSSTYIYKGMLPCLTSQVHTHTCLSSMLPKLRSSFQP